jgi:hypothetical protein
MTSTGGSDETMTTCKGTGVNRPSLLGAVVAIALVILPAPPAAQEGKKLKVAGTVVDAACFMMHPDAAMLPSHKDCGEACLARGVPLAIISEADGQMYFAADGNGRLTRFHQKRVSAEGIAVRKKDPLELKMPVDDGKEMTVTVRGGYNVLTIQSLAEAPRK